MHLPMDIERLWCYSRPVLSVPERQQNAAQPFWVPRIAGVNSSYRTLLAPGRWQRPFLSETVVPVLDRPQSDIEHLPTSQVLHLLDQAVRGVELRDIVAAANADPVYENIRYSFPSCAFRKQSLQRFAEGMFVKFHYERSRVDDILVEKDALGTSRVWAVGF